VLLAVLVLLLAPANALAHVTILPDTSRPGESGEFGFRVQNERTDATTDKLEVFIPDGVPVEAEPARGWTITRIAGGIQWSGSSIPPGRTEEFKVRLGPLPDRGEIVFKALQYYADGQVVRWIQEPTKDAERPAAVLDLGGASGAVATGDEPGGFPWPLIAGLVVVVALVAVGVTLGRRRGI
jgi:periplasmic copper chaperone A